MAGQARKCTLGAIRRESSFGRKNKSLFRGSIIVIDVHLRQSVSGPIETNSRTNLIPWNAKSSSSKYPTWKITSVDRHGARFHIFLVATTVAAKSGYGQQCHYSRTGQIWIACSEHSFTRQMNWRFSMHYTEPARIQN